MPNAPNRGHTPPSGDDRAPRDSEQSAAVDGAAEPPALLDEAVYELLQNRRRRYLLYCLDYHDGEVSLSRAVDVVTAWETNCPVEDVRSTDRRCVYAALRRRHIPRLETENVVTLDEDSGVVSFDLDAEKVTRWLVAEDGSRWSKYYLGFAVLGGVFVLADVLTAVPSLSEGITHLAVTLLFLGLTVLVVYDHWR